MRNSTSITPHAPISRVTQAGLEFCTSPWVDGLTAQNKWAAAGLPACWSILFSHHFGCCIASGGDARRSVRLSELAEADSPPGPRFTRASVTSPKRENPKFEIRNNPKFEYREPKSFRVRALSRAIRPFVLAVLFIRIVRIRISSLDFGKITQFEQHFGDKNYSTSRSQNFGSRFQSFSRRCC